MTRTRSSAPASAPIDLLLKYDRPVPRYTSYPTAAAFGPEVDGGDLAAQLERGGDAPLSLYVHVPFCRHACWYCGCNRITTQLGSKVVEPYLVSLSRELDLLRRHMPERRRLAQLHWGGGTPNYLNPEEQRQLWQLIGDHFELEEGIDAAIEVNPEFLSRQEVFGLRELGFSRISFGIQDADPDVQAAVNRVVPTDQLRRVMGWIREAGFQSVNVDLICGLPRQTPDRFAATIALVNDLRPDRISLFSFAYLPRMLPMQRKIAADDLPSARERIVMLDIAHSQLLRRGYAAIGMDHYALPEDPLAIAASRNELHRNFQGYTTGRELDLLGIGPTAISMFPTLFSQNQRQLKAYNASLEAGHLPVERGLRVTDPEVLERRGLISELMCHFAVSFDRQRYAAEWQDLEAMAADGLVLLQRDGRQGRAEATEAGRWLIRSIAAVFDPSQRARPSGARLV
ncbi:oxygen-independent coproporphyrinogen III oxidase [Synechococcus sp. RSCCF101]|nr:oxygen-independent coproporphyrinogen III oxidase [Synechococcus sp. RSCCF101]